VQHDLDRRRRRRIEHPTDARGENDRGNKFGKTQGLIRLFTAPSASGSMGPDTFPYLERWSSKASPEEHPRVARDRRRRRSHAAALLLSAARGLHGQRQHRRGGELVLLATRAARSMTAMMTTIVTIEPAA
jgi:hypothetical protein